MTPAFSPFLEPLPPEHGVPRLDPRRVRRAVLAGVGEARNDASASTTHAVALMAEAAGAAAQDAGFVTLLRDVGLVCATVGSDDAPDPAGAVRECLDLAGAATMVARVGVSQQRLVSTAILAVETGRVDAVLVLGGEAKASALAVRRSGESGGAGPQGPGADTVLQPEGEFMAEAEVDAQLWDPVAQYALIDSALARAEGRSPAELRDDVSELWARFDTVATANPHAAFALPRTARELATTTDDNRLLAFPYNKWHSTQWAVDHAAALLICTEEVAHRHGEADDRILFPLVALDSSWGLTLSRRAEVHRWPAMQRMGHHAGVHLGGPVGHVDLLEVYSCFPAAVRVQQRELDLPLDGTPTMLGGMAFAGGPFNHYTYMATVDLARRLRAGSPEGVAVVTTVSGLLTKAGLMAWGREPHPEGALVADLAAEVEAATARREVAGFDPGRGVMEDDIVVAATVTGGFDPRLIALVDDGAGVRRIVVDRSPLDDPAATLAAL